MTEVYLPGLPFPPSVLRPNARTHPRAWRRHAAAYAAAVGWTIRARLGPPPWPCLARARLRLEAVYPDRRHWWDDDALVAAWKSARDQLVRLGLLVGDEPGRLTTEIAPARVDRAACRPYLNVTLIPAAASAGRPGPPRSEGPGPYEAEGEQTA